jgi:hypothetical protein
MSSRADVVGVRGTRVLRRWRGVDNSLRAGRGQSLIARGRSMNERALAQAQRNERAFGQYVRETAGASTTSTADELSKLADLRDRGTISDEEFQHAKAKLLGKQPEPVAPAYTDGHAVPSTR